MKICSALESAKNTSEHMHLALGCSGQLARGSNFFVELTSCAFSIHTCTSVNFGACAPMALGVGPHDRSRLGFIVHGTFQRLDPLC